MQSRRCVVHQAHSPANHSFNSVLSLWVEVQPSVVGAVVLSTQWGFRQVGRGKTAILLLNPNPWRKVG
eukprot:4470983-Amphidinium_carterae.1